MSSPHIAFASTALAASPVSTITGPPSSTSLSIAVHKSERDLYSAPSDSPIPTSPFVRVSSKPTTTSTTSTTTTTSLSPTTTFLPRTSSLLPPARLNGPSSTAVKPPLLLRRPVHVPSTAASPTADPLLPLTDPPLPDTPAPVLPRDSPRASQHANSVGPDRWSSSTASADSPKTTSRIGIPFASLPPIVSLPSLDLDVPISYDPPLSDLMSPSRHRSPHIRQRSSEDNTQSFYFGDASAQTHAHAHAHTPSIESPPTARAKSRADSETSVPPYRSNMRSRSQAKGTADPASTRARERTKAPSQKAMLSRALQKANAAVQLDNAGNVEGARQAYSEACVLLQQVLLKTQGEDDRRKLEAIRVTYTARIDELDQLGPASYQDVRPLPKRPSSNNSRRIHGAAVYVEDDASDADREDDDPNDDRQDDRHDRPPTRTKVRAQTTERQRGLSPRSADPANSYTTYVATSPASQHSNTGPSSQQAKYGSSLLNDQYTLQSSFSRSPRKESHRPNDLNLSSNGSNGSNGNLQPPGADQYMPPPLSPRRVAAAAAAAAPTSVTPVVAPEDDHQDTSGRAFNGHTRAASHESISWLDPIDESGGSTASSVHSRSSSRIVRKHIRAASGATEAEFDAALDDAIEAAYDDGYDPMSPRNTNHNHHQHHHHDVFTGNEPTHTNEYTRGNFLDPADDSDEEERMLEEMTNGYAIEDFAFGGAYDKGAPVPHESDSSDMTSRTWHSSTGSNPPTTTATGLSTVSENTVVPPNIAKGFSGSAQPPPTQALPKLPPQSRSVANQSPSRGGGGGGGGGGGTGGGAVAAAAAGGDTPLSVRNRRLSGQSTRQLKIDTSSLSSVTGTQQPATAVPFAGSSISSSTIPASATVSQPPRTAGFLSQQRQPFSTGGPIRPSTRPGPSGDGNVAPPSFPPPTPPIPQGVALAENDNTMGRSASPALNKPGLKKNFSSSSLRSVRGRNMSVTNLEDGGSDMSPGTPLSSQFALNNRMPAMPTLPTPIAAVFRDKMNGGIAVGGMYLLESDFHSPSLPGSPNPAYSDAPVPLEPCPTDSMLRPFWLMRCLFQTIAHPRGGYLSNKLFVPSDVWRVKGVKLKNVDEKVANCDLLTAALLKLGRVDTYDADAILDEMQSFEGVLEQVQIVLGRKLGNDVGVQSAHTLFRDASISLEGEVGANGSGSGGVGSNGVSGGGGGGGSGSGSGNGGAGMTNSVPRTASVSGNRSFSWRRLRSKNSSAGLGSNYSSSGRKESLSEGMLREGSSGIGGLGASSSNASLTSLPMTSHPTSKPVRRDLATARFTGPHAQYMAALARLFDAAQSIDQIARQVEDPGLRHADKTQVGLELCTRRAAEFFAFYICRFVLQDVILLLEKFVKRGSEWVLS